MFGGVSTPGTSLNGDDSELRRVEGPDALVVSGTVEGVWVSAELSRSVILRSIGSMTRLGRDSLGSGAAALSIYDNGLVIMSVPIC